MANRWDAYSRQTIDFASAATSAGFSAVRRGTRLGFRIARGIAETAAGVTSTVADIAMFGGDTVVRPIADSTVDSVFTFAEHLFVAPIDLSEYITSTSLLAAHTSINVLSTIFPGSSEASFSLASFITLVRREWSDCTGNPSNKKFGVTQIARAVIAWVALQGATQEWQEKRWFSYLKELAVDCEKPITRPRRHSGVRVTSDIIFPGRGGPQIISANIGEAPPGTLTVYSRSSTMSSISSFTMTSKYPPSPTISHAHSIQHLSRKSSHTSFPASPLHQVFPTSPSHHLFSSSPQSIYVFPSLHDGEPKALPFDELKPTLRRLSKMVLAGYGGASLLFFGAAPHIGGSFQNGEAREKKEEEAKLEVAVDAAEAEAAGVQTQTSRAVPSLPKYSWWNQLLGRHDQEIFEKSILNSEEKEKEKEKGHKKVKHSGHKAQKMKGDSEEKEMKDSGSKAQKVKEAKTNRMKSTAIVGTEHLMPRFWVLTDYNRGQIVLVIRGTMSLNEIAVDLTCHPEPFELAISDRTRERETEDHIPGRCTEKGQPNQPAQDSRRSTYFVHSGMLRLARAMGEVGKPVQSAVEEALHHNPGFDLVLCGHSLGAGVAAILGLMWADPRTCLTVPSSGLPVDRRVYIYCFAPPALTDAKLSRLANKLVTSFVYSHDVVARLSLGSVRDLRNAALWLCDAEQEKHTSGKEGGEVQNDGWSAVTSRARRCRKKEDMDWLIAVRKTLEANMQEQNMFPPGRVLWAMRDADLHVSHRKNKSVEDMEMLRLFEVLDVEKVFDQIVFARNMLTAHMPHVYDRVLHDLL